MTTKKPKGKQMGRPKIEIEKQTFENLCKIQCTQSEIASVLNASEDTILRWCKSTYGDTFAASYKKLSEGGRTSLRRAQWIAAMKGNPTMLIWMGKQILGQKDQQRVETVKEVDLSNLTPEEIHEIAFGTDQEKMVKNEPPL